MNETNEDKYKKVLNEIRKAIDLNRDEITNYIMEYDLSLRGIKKRIITYLIEKGLNNEIENLNKTDRAKIYMLINKMITQLKNRRV
ncbi:MAG: hypothetical protein QXW35_03655 [Candidatus Aenigmatarchaeota archaeon]